MSRNQLCIDQNIATEDQSRSTSVDQLDRLATREECRRKTKDDQNPQSAKQIWHPAREIILRLAGEQCQGNEDAQRDDQSL